MIVYIIIAILFLIDLINPKLIWQINYLKYKDKSMEPSPTYMVASRVIAALAFIIVCIIFYQKYL